MNPTCHEEYKIVVYQPEEFDGLETHWRTLERGSDMTAFQSFDWYRNINSLYKLEKVKNCFRTWRYIAVFDNEAPLLIAPLEIKKIGCGYKQYGASSGIYFIGRVGYTDYLNFVYNKFDADALSCLIDYLHTKYPRLPFFFERMLEMSQSYCYLAERYSHERFPVSCAALYLPDSFEEYRTNLSKNTRQNIRTAVNRANRNGIMLTHEFVLDEDKVLKEKILVLNEERLSKKAASSKKEMSLAGKVYCFFADLSRRLFSAKLDVIRVSNNTFCFLVRDDDRIVSFFWGIRNDYLKELYVILVGVDKEYEWYSPNISHLYLYLEEYYKEKRNDLRIIDFTRGAEGYKKTIGCKTRAVSGLRFRIP